MKALTVQQPWAWAILYGGKDVENRTQAWSYRGPLAVHAGRRPGWSLRILTEPPADINAPTAAELAAGQDLTPYLIQPEPPWPVVGECHSSHRTDHSCRQCDGSHDHDWVAWREPVGPVLGLTGPGLPVRCKTCGARKCDRSDCLLRRHHRGPHELY